MPGAERRRAARAALGELLRPEIPAGASPRQRWERRAEGPMLALSVLFLLLYAWSCLRAGSTAVHLADVGMWVVWACFAVDYLVRLALAEDRGRWFTRHLLELALVVLPMFRPLRILRLVSVLVVAQRFSASSMRVTVAVYTAFSSVLVLLVGALTIYSAERGAPGGGIGTFWDALWWSVVTVTTVGYGDISPVTLEGRFTAALLMLGGIALLGVVTATVASWLVQQVAGDAGAGEAARDAELLAELRALRGEVAELRAELRGDPPAGAAGPDGPDGGARPGR